MGKTEELKDIKKWVSHSRYWLALQHHVIFGDPTKTYHVKIAFKLRKHPDTEIFSHFEYHVVETQYTRCLAIHLTRDQHEYLTEMVDGAVDRMPLYDLGGLTGLPLHKLTGDLTISYDHEYLVKAENYLLDAKYQEQQARQRSSYAQLQSSSSQTPI